MHGRRKQPKRSAHELTVRLQDPVQSDPLMAYPFEAAAAEFDSVDGQMSPFPRPGGSTVNEASSDAVPTTERSGATEDPLSRAAAGPPIDWDDSSTEPEEPGATDIAPDPLHSIYGPPPGHTPGD